MEIIYVRVEGVGGRVKLKGKSRQFGQWQVDGQFEALYVIQIRKHFSVRCVHI